MSRSWAGRFLSGPASLPVSFRLDGRPAAGMPDAWQPAARRRRIDANIIETSGQFADVLVTEALPNSLRGRLVPAAGLAAARTA